MRNWTIGRLRFSFPFLGVEARQVGQSGQAGQAMQAGRAGREGRPGSQAGQAGFVTNIFGSNELTFQNWPKLLQKHTSATSSQKAPLATLPKLSKETLRMLLKLMKNQTILFGRADAN